MDHGRQYLENASYTWSKDSIRLILSPSPLAKSIYFHVQETGYFKTSDSYYTERKNLNSFLIVYTLTGKGQLQYQGREYTLCPGSLFFIHCMEHHRYLTPPGEKWEFLWVHFNGPSALGYYKEFVRSGFRTLEYGHSHGVKNYMTQILHSSREKSRAAEPVVSALITNLLTEVLLKSPCEGSGSFSMPDYIRSVMAEIEHNFSASLSLDYLADLYGVSKFHLSRQFKKYTGMTVNEFIIRTRITYAKGLLKYSDLSISDIAAQSGVSHVSHFINLFKAREGITPLAYRKQWK